jgi:hypothetical protein
MPTNDKSFRRLKDEAQGGKMVDAPDGPKSNDKSAHEITNQDTYCGHPNSMDNPHAKAMAKKHGPLYSE